MIRAVAGCVDVWIRSLAMIVYDNAIVAGESCGFGKLDIGYDPNTDNNQVGSKFGITTQHFLNFAFTAKTRDPGIGVDVYPRPRCRVS